MNNNTIRGGRLAKNTIVLYIRMLLTLMVSLYTSRVVLQTLGVEDYGVYNVVGGIVAMFSFLNTAMVASTQRFMSYSLGNNDYKKLQKVFSNSLLIHTIIAVVIVLLSETLGLWLLYNKMIIPNERFEAAFGVYQMSICVFVLNVIRVPDNSVIIAHEKMGVYAYISIIDVILKLLIVFLLPILPFDKLLLYGFFILVVTILINIAYRVYARNNFEEAKLSLRYDKDLFNDMFGFAGWSLWGNLASSLSNYGLNIVLNMFFGPVVNAARGIAYQVQAAIIGFGSNFMVAVNPQIIKSYAQEDYKYMTNLVFRSSKFAYYLLFLIAIPVMSNINFVLKLWLETPPQYTSVFIVFILVDSLINILSAPIQTSINATGKIKVYQIVVGGILLINLPLSYILLKMGYNVLTPFITTILLSIIAFVFRLIILKLNTKISISKYCLVIIPRIALVSIISCALIYVLNLYDAQSFGRLVFNVSMTILILILIIGVIGLNTEEKQLFIAKFQQNRCRND